MFKKLFKKLIEAESEHAIEIALYGIDGVVDMFSRDRITWDEHEMLFELAAKLEKAFD